MKAYQIDSEGFLLGELELQLDPLETKIKKKPVYLLPAGSVKIAPPDSTPYGQEPKWNGSSWEMVESRVEIQKKKAQGREFVNGKWTDPKPSPDHVLSNGQWIIPPEVQAEIEKREAKKVKKLAAKEILKNRVKAKTIDDLEKILEALIELVEIN